MPAVQFRSPAGVLQNKPCLWGLMIFNSAHANSKLWSPLHLSRSISSLCARSIAQARHRAWPSNGQTHHRPVQSLQEVRAQRWRAKVMHAHLVPRPLIIQRPQCVQHLNNGIEFDLKSQVLKSQLNVSLSVNASDYKTLRSTEGCSERRHHLFLIHPSSACYLLIILKSHTNHRFISLLFIHSSVLNNSHVLFKAPPRLCLF